MVSHYPLQSDLIARVITRHFLTAVDLFLFSLGGHLFAQDTILGPMNCGQGSQDTRICGNLHTIYCPWSSSFRKV